MALIGDTIRLRAEFRTWDGLAADPENIELRIYDKDRRQIGETISISSGHRTALGAYQYDFIVPNQSSPVYYEFSGLLEDAPIVARSRIEVDWV